MKAYGAAKLTSTSGGYVKFPQSPLKTSALAKMILSPKRILKFKHLQSTLIFMLCIAATTFLSSRQQANPTDEADQKSTRIAVLTSSVGNYNLYLREWADNMGDYFCTDDASVQVDFLVWTDQPEILAGADRVTTFPSEAIGWPQDSALRPKGYLTQSKRLLQYDFIVSMDIDLRMVTHICRDIISFRTACHQSWFWQQPISTFPLETNVESAAYIPNNVSVSGYFAGGFIVAASAEFLNICKQQIDMIERDQQHGIMAIWHDETYWNKYLSENPPALILSPYYVYPEPPVDMWLLQTYPHIWLDPSKQFRAQRPRMIHLRKRRAQDILRTPNTAQFDPIEFVCSKVTMTIKTFIRPQCLKDIISSIYRRYPCLRIVVADDSPDIDHSYIVTDNSLLTYVKLPFDSGLSAGRNAMLAHVHTEYMFLIDDDFLFPSDFKLEAFVDILENVDVDVLAGPIMGEPSSFILTEDPAGTLNVHGHVNAQTVKGVRESTISLLKTNKGETIAGCYYTDMVTNVFLARIAAVKQVRWDDRLKLGEHEDFFYRAKFEHGLKVGVCKDQMYEVQHDNSCGRIAAANGSITLP
jgi:histo-blood group ABO system transferase